MPANVVVIATGASATFGSGPIGAAPAPGPSISLSGPTTATAGSAATYTVTAANLTGPLVVTPVNVTGTAVFSPTTVNPAPGELSKLFSATWAAAGSYSIKATAPGVADSNTLAVSVSDVPTPPPPPPPSGTTLTSVTLNAPSAGTHAWAMGHAFRQGEIPTGTTLQTVQLSPISTWPDGSVRFGIVAGITALAANTDTAQALTTGTAPPGAAVTTSGLSGVTAVIAGSVSGSATFSGADWASPFRTVCTGPVMSSWVYRKTIDATLHAYVEVRLWSNGATEFLPWLENGYVLVAGTTSRNETWTFDLGGTQRESIAADFPGRTRLVLLTGTKLAHWLGTDPEVFPRWDAAYIESTKVTPNYGTSSPDSAFTSWAETITAPHEQGLYPSGMGTGGYHLSIGLLPRWDAAVLTNTSRKVWRVAQQQAYRAGRYGVYWRDENTLRAPRMLDHPTRVIGGAGSGVSDTGSGASYGASQTGTVPPTWKVSHLPSMGFMAALMTGRWCHIETAQFHAAIGPLNSSTTYRQNGDGVLQTYSFLQPRGVAWALRSLAQAAAISADDDPLQTEFERQLSNTAAFNHARYVAQASHPFGFMNSILPGLTDGYTPGTTPPLAAGVWMHDFIVACVGYARQLTGDGLTESAKFAAWFNWLGKSVACRVSEDYSASGYPYRYAAAFVLATAAQDDANWDDGSGPWPATAGDMWRWTWAAPSGAESAFAALWSQQPGCSAPPTKEAGDGSLLFGGIGSTGSYWHNLMPALAYCAEFGVEGCAAGYQRVVNAPNFASGVAAYDAADPTWAVRSRGIIAWGAGTETGTLAAGVWTPGRNAEGVVTQASINTLPLNQMVKVSGTSMQALKTALEATGFNFASHDWSGGKDIRRTTTAWVGMAFDGRRSYVYAGGGHEDSSINGTWGFDVMRMAWEIVDEPSRPDAVGAVWDPDYDIPPNGTFTNYTTAAGVQGLDPDGLYQDKLPDGKPTSRHNYMGTAVDTKRGHLIDTRVSKWTQDLTTHLHTRQRWTFDGGPAILLTIHQNIHYHAGTDSLWGLWSKTDGDNGTFGQCALPGSNIVTRAGCTNFGRGAGTITSVRLDEDRVLYFWFTASNVERWGIHNMQTNAWEAGSGGTVTNPPTLPGFTFDHEMQAACHIPTWGAQGQVIRRGTVGSLRGTWWLFDIATKTNNLSWTPAGATMPTFCVYPGNKYFKADALGVALFLDDVFDTLGSQSNIGQTAMYVMRYR